MVFGLALTVFTLALYARLRAPGVSHRLALAGHVVGANRPRPGEQARRHTAPRLVTPVAAAPLGALEQLVVDEVTPDGDVIAIRPVMNMVLAIDHRANDGAQAAALLRSIKTWLEAIGPETPVY